MNNTAIDAKKYTMKREPIRVTELLKLYGLYKIQNATDEHLWRGTAMHEMMKLYHGHELNVDSLDPILMGCLKGWQSFEKDTGFKPLGFEHTMIHPYFNYRGTPDVWGYIGNKICVIDYKSGQVPRVTGLQLALYEELLKASGKIGLDEKVNRLGITLYDDGTYTPRPFDDDNDRNICLMMLSVYNWGINHV